MINNNKAYIIETYTNMCGGYTTPRFIEESRFLGVDLKVIGVKDTIIKDNKIIHEDNVLSKREFILIRQKTGHLMNALSKLGNSCYNDPYKIEIYKDKYQQYKNIESSLIIKPKSIVGYLGLSYFKIINLIGTPFVAKGLVSSQGKDVFLINNEIEYTSLIENRGNFEEMLFQEFISTSFGKDLRVFAIQGDAIACMKRSSNGSFKANFALGGSVSDYKIDDDIRMIVKHLHEITGLFYMGVDLLFGDSGYVFCELNITPGIKGIEKATGKNIAREILTRIKDAI